MCMAHFNIILTRKSSQTTKDFRVINGSFIERNANCSSRLQPSSEQFCSALGKLGSVHKYFMNFDTFAAIKTHKWINNPSESTHESMPTSAQSVLLQRLIISSSTEIAAEKK